MAKLQYQNNQGMCHSVCTLNTDHIKRYKLSGKSERDMMWMRYRNLRKLFDRIEESKVFKDLNSFKT